MQIHITGIVTPLKQRGAALIMSLLILLVLTVLGVFGMGTTRLENMMAGNHQFQTASLGNAEMVIAAANQQLASLSPIPDPNTTGDCLHFSLDDAAKNVPQLPGTWPADSETCTYTPVSGEAPENFRYVMEYLGDGVNPPDKICTASIGTGAAAPCPIKVYRVTARHDGSRGARRTVQTYYEMTRGPGDI